MKKHILGIMISLCFVMLAIPIRANAMWIYVQVNMDNSTFFSLEVESGDSIDNIKQKIYELKGYPVSEQTLTFAKISLEDGKTLADYNIQKEAVLKLSVKLEYDVTLVDNNATRCDELNSYKFGEGAILPVPEKTGLEFDGWYDNAKLEGERIAEILSSDYGDKTFYAKWIDTQCPVISGVEDGKTYCESTEITVTDNDELEGVTVNGVAVELENGKYIPIPSSNEQKIVAKDKSGNVTEVNFWVKPYHSYNWETDEECFWAECSVCGKKVDRCKLPSLSINLPDAVCSGEDYVFTAEVETDENVELLYKYVTSGGIGKGMLDVEDNNGIKTGEIISSKFSNDEYLTITVLLQTTDGKYIFEKIEKTVYVKHHGKNATCTEKSVCEGCGEEFGGIDAKNHSTLKYIEPTDATTENYGNIGYWYCEGCVKYFADEECKSELKASEVVLPKLEKGEDNVPQTGANKNVENLVVVVFSLGLIGALKCVLRKNK